MEKRILEYLKNIPLLQSGEIKEILLREEEWNYGGGLVSSDGLSLVEIGIVIDFLAIREVDGEGDYSFIKENTCIGTKYSDIAYFEELKNEGYEEEKRYLILSK